MNLKFRAWDKKNDLIKDVITIYLSENAVEFHFQHGENPEYKQLHEVVLMQSTGLKDKNGVEIFEGDIVLFDDGDIAHVVKHRGAFWIEGSSVPMAMESHYDMVVRGNIYENRELLEVAE